MCYALPCIDSHDNNYRSGCQTVIPPTKNDSCNIELTKNKSFIFYPVSYAVYHFF